MRNVMIVLRSNFGMLELASAFECFRHASELGGGASYSVTTCSAGYDALQLEEPWIRFSAVYNLNNAPPQVDTLIVPDASPVTLRDHDLRIIEFLSKRTPTVRRVAAYGNGVLFAAAAGITRGHTVVADAETQARLPTLCSQTLVEPHSDLHKSGKIWTARGTGAGLALTLALIEEDLGRTTAVEVARRIGARLDDADTRYRSRMARVPSFDQGSPVERVQEWVMANPSADLSVGKLAAMVAMSEKTLSRAFKQKTGDTVGEFVLSVRLRYACDMLKAGERKIKDIARLSGLGSQSNMRQLFITRFGCTPTAYRDLQSGQASSPDDGESEFPFGAKKPAYQFPESANIA
ncbi:MAG: helix-turn-helix domain-containing protein [Rhizobium sp.]|nr:helix-turn-helix domain-containing protein [Rhizobium sp.]MCZ8352630.1 helix-turn-helix domain-containing protein [Rhizobium sp.]